MTAICGELPASLIPRFAGGDRYKELVVLSLKKEKLLTVFSQDHLRGYRLGRRAKSLLLESQPERFSFFLSGRSDTNHIKSETARRARLHRVAASTLLALNSGASVFRDEKPYVFASPETSLQTAFDLSDMTAFYSSREVKEMGLDATRIRGSRMTGVLLAPSAAYLMYQGGVQMPELDHKAEQRARSFLLHVLCGSRFAGRYGPDRMRTILACDDMQVLVEILQGAQTPKRHFFLLEESHSDLYYLTNDHQGDVLLGLLCDPDRQAAFNQVLLSELRAPPHGLPVEYDAVDKAGRPVLFSYLPDIPRLGRFLAGLSLHGLQGCIACFDFQAQALGRCCGENVTLLPISFDQFERGFCP